MIEFESERNWKCCGKYTEEQVSFCLQGIEKWEHVHPRYLDNNLAIVLVSSLYFYFY